MRSHEQKLYDLIIAQDKLSKTSKEYKKIERIIKKLENLELGRMHDH